MIIAGFLVLLSLTLFVFWFSRSDISPTDPNKAASPKGISPEVDQREDGRVAHNGVPEKTKPVDSEEARVLDLWKRHGGNFTSVEGQVFAAYLVKVREPAYVRVVQIIDDENMLATVIDGSITEAAVRPRSPQLDAASFRKPPGRPVTGEETWWLARFSTRGLVDGKTYAPITKADESTLLLDLRLAIIGTKRYPTAGGGSRTVVLAAPVSSLNGISLKEFRNVIALASSLGPDLVQKQEEDREWRAVNQYDWAMSFLKSGQVETARKMLEQVGKMYSETDAAGWSMEMLKKVNNDK